MFVWDGQNVANILKSALVLTGKDRNMLGGCDGWKSYGRIWNGRGRILFPS